MMVSKICRWDGGVCLLPSCSTLSPSGEVEVCFRHRNSHGRSVRRKGVS